MNTESWRWKRGYWKFFILDGKIKEKVARWKKAKLHCRYFLPNGKRAWDFIVPSELYNRLAQLLDIPLRKKSPKRIIAGEKVGRFFSTRRFTKVKSRKTGYKPRKMQDHTLVPNRN